MTIEKKLKEAKESDYFIKHVRWYVRLWNKIIVRLGF